MVLLWQVVWAIMLLLFLAGAVTYALRPHFGLELIKRAAVLVGVLLIGPSLVLSILSAIPFWLFIVIAVGASLAAYQHVTASKKDQHRHGASSAHAERHPRLPHGGDEHHHQ